MEALCRFDHSTKRRVSGMIKDQVFFFSINDSIIRILFSLVRDNYEFLVSQVSLTIFFYESLIFKYR